MRKLLYALIINCFAAIALFANGPYFGGGGVTNLTAGQIATIGATITNVYTKTDYSFCGFNIKPVSNLPLVTTSAVSTVEGRTVYEIRDPVIWYGRGKLWGIFQTLDSLNYTVANYRNFLVSSTNNGETWTLHGNTVTNFISSGGLPYVYNGVQAAVYDATNDVLRFWTTSFTNKLYADFSSGPWDICGLKYASNADWTAIGTYTVMNDGNPVFTNRIASHYDGNSGGGEPCVIMGATNWLMYYQNYSVADGHTISAAYPTTNLDGTWTRYSTNSVLMSGANMAEEPAVLRLNDGTFISINDQGDSAGTAIWFTSITNGLSGWNVVDADFIRVRPVQYLGSGSIAIMPDGSYYVLAGGFQSGNGRQMYGFYLAPITANSFIILPRTQIDALRMGKPNAFNAVSSSATNCIIGDAYSKIAVGIPSTGSISDINSMPGVANLGGETFIFGSSRNNSYFGGIVFTDTYGSDFGQWQDYLFSKDDTSFHFGSYSTINFEIGTSGSNARTSITKPTAAVMTVNSFIGSGTLTASNSFTLYTNYIASNFIPIAGQLKIVASNSTLYVVSSTATNKITVAP